MALRRDLVVGQHRAVHEDVLSLGAVVGRDEVVERVLQLVLRVEVPVGDHQRQVAVAARQRQREVDRVLGDPHAGEAAPDVLAGAVEAVVVVPVHRGALVGAVLGEVVAVLALVARLDQKVVAGLALGEPGGDVAKERARLRVGEAAGLPVVLRAGVRAVEVDGQLAGLLAAAGA